MLLKALGYVPFVRTLVWFNGSVHRSTFAKFASLWILSILPLVFSGLRGNVPPNVTAPVAFLERVRSEFNSTSLFVFAISFLVPMLYQFYERFAVFRNYGLSRKRAPKHYDTPPGYSCVLLGSVLVFALTAFAYGNSGTGTTVLDWLVGRGLVLVVYLYSIYCWYLTMLIDAHPRDPMEIVNERRSQENEVAKGLSQRVAAGDNDE